MSAQVAITQLPAAGAITGTEAVPIVQNGVTVQTTTGAISASPSQIYQYVTAIQTAALPNSRYLSSSTGIGITNGGAQGPITIALNGVSASLESASDGIIVKSGGAVIARALATSGAGLNVSNGSGVSGNPTFQLTGVAASVANLTGTGMLALTSAGTAVTGRDITGTANQINVVNGNGASGNPTISLANNAIFPGTASINVPSGTTGQRPSPAANGDIRYNTTIALFEGYLNGAWSSFASGSGVTSVGSGTGLLGGPITSVGTLSIDDTVVATLTGTQTLTGKTISGASNTVSVTNSLTIGTGLTGSSYNGSAPVTIAIDSTVVTLTGSQTLTNKTINAANNTLSNIPNSSLTNSSVTLGSTNVALGGTTATLGGLTSVAVTQDPVSALQLATKQYVDAVAEGLHVHASCAAATTGTLASITGGTVTYNNGTAGVGATLTLSVALTVLDGYTLLNGDRVLVKNEVATANNGIYTWATGGTVLTRATDFDTAAEMASGDFTFVSNGTLYANTGWVQTDPVTTVGTSPVTWIQFSGAGSYTAGNGLQLIGSQFSLVTPVSLSNGGTGQTSASAAFNALSPITTTGDLIVGNGTNSATRLGIGTAGFVLKSTGTTAAWQLNPTYLPVVLHDASSTNISVASGYLPVLLHDGVTTVNVALF